MTGDEASLIARLQCALIGEGVHHAMHTQEQADTDGGIIREAVGTAWPDLKDWERRTLRHWRPGPKVMKHGEV